MEYSWKAQIAKSDSRREKNLNRYIIRKGIELVIQNILQKKTPLQPSLEKFKYFRKDLFLFKILSKIEKKGTFSVLVRFLQRNRIYYIYICMYILLLVFIYIIYRDREIYYKVLTHRILEALYTPQSASASWRHRKIHSTILSPKA